MMPDLSRRRFLYQSLTSFGTVILAGSGCERDTHADPRGAASPKTSRILPPPRGAEGFSALQPPDANQLRLPEGFTSRVIATTGAPVGSTEYRWHGEPDGGATFATPDGGWIYVSNAEIDAGGGGVGAIRFDQNGEIMDAYSILSGTTRNCAGGPTPWATWLSCEEIPEGRVWECDPLAKNSQGIPRPAMGIFNHEAAAVDPIRKQIYLTEDARDGRLYRFRPSDYPNLDRGALEVAEIVDPEGLGPIRPGETRTLKWHPVPDPGATSGVATREQVSASTPFDGGEGAWQNAGRIFFATKGDHRVWEIDARSDRIRILYEHASAEPGRRALRGVDNVFAARTGDVLVAEDGGDFEIVALTPSGQVKPIVQIMDQARSSEVTGPALSPDGSRLYFSSQNNPGRTYEVRGPFV